MGKGVAVALGTLVAAAVVAASAIVWLAVGR